MPSLTFKDKQEEVIAVPIRTKTMSTPINLYASIFPNTSGKVLLLQLIEVLKL
jgi:hypothetical protein